MTALKSKKTNLNDKDRTVNKSDCKEVPFVKVKKTDPNLETENYLRSHILILMNIGGQWRINKYGESRKRAAIIL